jgi:hypothetical protein
MFDDIRRKAKIKVNNWYYEQVNILLNRLNDVPSADFKVELTKLNDEYVEKLKLYNSQMIRDTFEYKGNSS